MLKFENFSDQQFYERVKDEFITKANSQIRVYELLNRAFPIVAEVIKSFDGKVLNARLANKVEEELNHISSDLHASLEIIYSQEHKNNVGYLEVRKAPYASGLHRSMKINIMLSSVSDGNRVVWSKTAEWLDSCKDVLPGYIAEWKQMKKDFDKAYNGACRFNMEMRKRIEDYQNRYSHALREFFCQHYLVKSQYYV